MPALLQRVYAGRGVFTQQELSLKLAELPRPDALRGLDAALDLLCTALREDQSVLIVGDFDADGATSTTLAVLVLRAFGFKQVDFLVPNRFDYGYGLTPEIVALAEQSSPDLIVTVDNGISSISGVLAAQAAGIKVLVTDHHLPGAELPAADAIVNPHQPDCAFSSKNLAGVGVVFYLLSALRARLREQHWFEEASLVEPNMADWLDLVALGTVADVVPLDKTNRVLVNEGLRRIRAGRARAGILALLELANKDRQWLVASDLGFTVGPRLNAAGRLDDMAVGIRCLLSEDPAEAKQLALQLDELNRDRRLIEADMQSEALALLAELNFDADNMPWGVCLYDQGWHQGVVGLLASRIKDKLHRPVVAFAEGGDDELKGSARSIPGFHIRDAFDAIASRHPGLLDRFGGHAMAAGLSLKKAQFPVFAAAFDEEVRRQLAPENLEAEVLTDGELAADDFNLDVAQQLRDGGPWGQHFPEPCFYGDFTVVQHRVVGGKHLKLVLSYGPSSEQMVDAIAFNTVEEGSAPVVPEQLSAVFRLDINRFRGRESLQLMVEHLLV
ncbi:MAG: single-stranded-DNA-specific exonuclease RecJ [Gammaproteobacteria bacterium]|nr:single-stranded-DNA-specific exonuclease RecJ [Gammaproteobacteria bacterium]MBQ0840072.1 single-stranded-DNA-specific exonuclease RecJ [Gammaproteobacteria bacterium]